MEKIPFPWVPYTVPYIHILKGVTHLGQVEKYILMSSVTSAATESEPSSKTVGRYICMVVPLQCIELHIHWYGTLLQYVSILCIK